MAFNPPSKRMSMADAFFLYFEKPNAPLHIGSLGIFEGLIPLEKAREGLEQRMHLIPRYRQRPVFPPLFRGHPTWEDDPDFSLDRHLRLIELPPPVREQQLHEVCAQIFGEPLPRDRPLWEIAVVHGLEGDRTGYVSRVHHCLVDGVSGIELLLALLDVSPEPLPMQPPQQPWQAKPMPNPLSSWMDAALDWWSETLVALTEWQKQLIDPRDALRFASQLTAALQIGLSAAMQPPSPVFWNRPVGKRRRFAFVTMPFQEVRGIRSTLGGTVNDVVLTILGGALGRYLQSHGEHVEGSNVRLMIPVNVRKEDQRGNLGNRVSMMLPQLPVGISDPIARLTAVREEMDRLKSADQGASFDTLLKLAETTPSAFSVVAGAIGLLPGMLNLVCTNVPGPLIPLYGSGHRMIASYPLLPLAADLGLGVAITSYDKSLYWGIICDPAIVPDVDRLRGLIDEEFRTLRDLASVPASDLPDVVPPEYRQPHPAKATDGARRPARAARAANKKAAVAARSAR